MLSDSLSTWDAKVNPKAPLSEKQNDAFIELSIKCQWTKRPFPNNVTRSSSVESTNSSTSQKIENAEQFFTWLSEIEEKIEEDTDYQHRSYVRQLREYTAQCTRLRDEMESTKSDLEGLNVKYVAVSSDSGQLHDACEKLLAEQTQLANDADCICSKLSFFTELDRVTSKLNSNQICVTSESFLPLLDRIDECMAYLKANPQYKQSSSYLAQFRSSLHRALSLVRVHVSDILTKATLQVLPHKDEDIQIDDAFTLFYGKFQTNAPRIKSILDDINQRTEKCSEYENLLNDCYLCYFTQRRTILTPSITKAIKDLEAKYTKDYCSLMRSGNSFLMHICEDEYALFMHFFSRSTPLLDDMLGEFCQMMYDLFRPLLIHISHLETLSELCSIIMVEMLQEHVQNNAVQLKAFGDICEQVLADVRERLVYRTYIYIRGEIAGYKPSPGDIAYPEKLQMMQSISETLSLENNPELSKSPFFDKNSDRPSHQSISPADLHGMWYPTVRRTLVCLSKLYRCLDKSTFQGLSQETLSMATLSLVNASELITEKKSKLDGALFLIKHLLILREQIAPFQVSFSIKETALDFSRIKDAAKDLLSARSSLFSLSSNNAVLQFLLDGTPQPMETLVDSKREVDKQLKMNCEHFIRYVVHDLVGNVQAFLDQAALIVEMNSEDSSRRVLLSNQPFASVEKLTVLVSDTYKRVKRKQLSIRKTMNLYLSNKDTEFILFKPIKNGVVSAFNKLLKFLNDNYSEDDRVIIACPSPEQVNLLISAPRNSSSSSSTNSLFRAPSTFSSSSVGTVDDNDLRAKVASPTSSDSTLTSNPSSSNALDTSNVTTAATLPTPTTAAASTPTTTAAPTPNTTAAPTPTTAATPTPTTAAPTPTTDAPATHLHAPTEPSSLTTSQQLQHQQLQKRDSQQYIAHEDQSTATALPHPLPLTLTTPLELTTPTALTTPLALTTPIALTTPTTVATPPVSGQAPLTHDHQSVYPPTTITNNSIPAPSAMPMFSNPANNV